MVSFERACELEPSRKTYKDYYQALDRSLEQSLRPDLGRIEDDIEAQVQSGPRRR